MYYHTPNTSLKLLMSIALDLPCRSYYNRRIIFDSWFSLSSSSSCRREDYQRYLLVMALLAGLRRGSSSLGPSSLGRSMISSLSSLNGFSTFSTVNSAMYRFCFSRISSRLAVVKNSISPAMAILLGGSARVSNFRLSSWLFSSLRLLSRVQNCCLYSLLISYLSLLLRMRTSYRSISKASFRHTSQLFLGSSYCQAGDSYSGESYLSYSRPKQRWKKSFYLHQKRNFCILVSQMEGRYMLLYCRQCSSILFFRRVDFSLRACMRSLEASLPTLLSSLEVFLTAALGATLALFLTDSLRFISISSLSLYSFSNCSLNIFKIYSWFILRSDLLCTTCRSPSPYSYARASLRELMDWKLGTEDIARLRFSGQSCAYCGFNYQLLIFYIGGIL